MTERRVLASYRRHIAGPFDGGTIRRSKEAEAALPPLRIKVPDNSEKTIAGVIIESYLDRSYYKPKLVYSVECGGCGALVTVHAWSWAGHGNKRCPQCHCRIPYYGTFAKTKRVKR